jgi:hypothetical protein
MTKINPTLDYSRHTAIAARPVTVDRSTDGAVRRPPPSSGGDRITLSDAGLAAAARFSNLIQRTANTYTLALPVPLNMSPAGDLSEPEAAQETPASRNLVRTTYAQQRELSTVRQAYPESRIDILV